VTFEIRLSPQPIRSFKKLDPDTKERIRHAIDALRHTPSSGPSVKRLKGLLRDYYRYRVGDYRIIYTVSQKTHQVFVDYIQHRKDVYRDIKH
jgi:mRNA interferase RelE/StbE